MENIYFFVAKGAVGAEDGAMREVRNCLGVEFEVPMALLKGQYAVQTRWRLIAEGISNVIAHCPPEHRAMVANLQYAWMQAMVERRKLEEPPPQMEFGCFQ